MKVNLLILLLFYNSLYGLYFTLTHASISFQDIFDEACLSSDYSEGIRRILHEHPEEAFNECHTQQIITAALNAHGIKFTTNWGIPPNGNLGSGVIAEIGTGHPPCVGIRAPMDGTPMQEEAVFSFTSKNKGYMHSAGNDGLMAMLLGAAKILKAHEDKLKGTVKLIFQPAETLGGGAQIMCEEGALTQYPAIQHMFSLDVDTTKPSSHISVKANNSHSSSHDFFIKINGKGGHAATPHLTIDPIPPSVAFINAIYDFCAREMYYQQDTYGLFSITSFESNTSAFNVIPDEVNIMGMYTAINNTLLKIMEDRMINILDDITQSYKCTYTLTTPYTKNYPAVMNDPKLVDFFTQLMKKANYKISEDEIKLEPNGFGFFSSQIPSLIAVIGSGTGDDLPGHPRTDTPLFYKSFALDEKIIPVGSILYSFFADQLLDKMSEDMGTHDEL